MPTLTPTLASPYLSEHAVLRVSRRPIFLDDLADAGEHSHFAHHNAAQLRKKRPCGHRNFKAEQSNNKTDTEIAY
jgi:hypothetical protein